MAKKHLVSFTAYEKVKEPAQISFNTKNGPVSFSGHKKVEEEVLVQFQAKSK